jgi:protein SCO1
MTRRRRVLVPALSAAMVGLCATGCGSTQHAAPPTTRAEALRGLLPSPLPHKPNFTLTDTTGHPYRLAARTRGKLVYLYFGYTHCPDVCPLTMANLAAALRRKPAAIRRRTDVVFVTVDPHRDTRSVLRAWLARYGEPFVGLTGSQAEIRRAEIAARVPLAPAERQRGLDYSVAHSSLMLTYSPDNRAHVVYSQGFTAADYAHDMPILLTY